MNPIIEVADLRKEFTVRTRAGTWKRRKKTVAAVAGVDLTIDRGEMVGYIGPNGAGKSTTLKMLTGVLYPSSGHVRVCGLEPVPQRLTLTRRIGVVFGQRSALWWDLPLRESFSLLRHVFNVPRAEHTARLDRCRSMLDLDDFSDTPVRQLSLGQRMRAELTAALLHGPAVLFLDEPTIGLDVVSKRAVRQFLADLKAAGDTTVVLTTHDLADIEKLCERLVVIDHGRVVHDGSLEALHQRYGSHRQVIIDFETPWQPGAAPAGVVAEVDADDPARVCFWLSATSPSAGELVAGLATRVPFRDVSIVEPDIENVIARLYTGR
jgi:ABC-2 type transport system ATP-binding protein